LAIAIGLKKENEKKKRKRKKWRKRTKKKKKSEKKKAAVMAERSRRCANLTNRFHRRMQMTSSL
jgi:hypothetical protein